MQHGNDVNPRPCNNRLFAAALPVQPNKTFRLCRSNEQQIITDSQRAESSYMDGSGGAENRSKKPFFVVYRLSVPQLGIIRHLKKLPDRLRLLAGTVEKLYNIKTSKILAH